MLPHKNSPPPPDESEPSPNLLKLVERIQAIWAQVPQEELDKLPDDGSLNHDHYLYGAPKRG